MLHGIDHLIAVSCESARLYLFSDRCKLTKEQIAKLYRKMPSFIAAKLEELEAGGTDINSNPAGAFDTNGWSEICGRLPKFRNHFSITAGGRGYDWHKWDEKGHITRSVAIVMTDG